MKTLSLEQLTHIETIKSVVYRLARALDRVDEDMLKSCFWDTATDDHGLFKGSASNFIDWVIPLLNSMKRTQHIIANVIIEFDGDTATVESYFLAYHELASDEQSTDMFAAGRYVDTFVLKEEQWKIQHRHAVYDWNRNDKSSHNWYEEPFDKLLERGERFPNDFIYKK